MAEGLRWHRNRANVSLAENLPITREIVLYDMFLTMAEIRENFKRDGRGLFWIMVFGIMWPRRRGTSLLFWRVQEMRIEKAKGAFLSLTDFKESGWPLIDIVYRKLCHDFVLTRTPNKSSNFENFSQIYFNYKSNCTKFRNLTKNLKWQILLGVPGCCASI